MPELDSFFQEINTNQAYNTAATYRSARRVLSRHLPTNYDVILSLKFFFVKENENDYFNTSFFLMATTLCITCSERPCSQAPRAEVAYIAATRAFTLATTGSPRVL